MDTMSSRIFALSSLLFLFWCAPVDSAEVTAPPESEIARLDLDPFYEKYLSADGFPIVSSAKVSDYALKEAAFVIGIMLDGKPEVRDALIQEKVRLAIMAPDEYTTAIPEHRHLKPKVYWDKRARGLGSSKEHPAVSCGEENLLRYRGDPYIDESIMIHEFAHSMHHQGLNVVDPTFQGKLENAFNRASLKGLWKGKYAGTNPAEYWAEGVQSWFDTNRENDHDHNHVDTREELKAHDPELAKLVESVFGDTEWRFLPPAKRKEPGHLEGYDPETAKTFAWPEEMVKAYHDYQEGTHLAKMDVREMKELPVDAKSPHLKTQVKIRIQNRTEQRLSVSWVDFDGKLKVHGNTDPGRDFDQQTFEGHLWVISGEDGEPFRWCETPGEDAIATIE